MNEEKISSLLLDEAKRLGADEASCLVAEGIKTEVDYSGGRIGMIRTTFNHHVSVKVLLQKKKGIASLNCLDEDSVRAVVRDAVENAQSALPDEAEGISDERGQLTGDTGDREADLEGMYDRFSGFLQDAKREFPAVSFDSATVNFTRGKRLYRNTNGVYLVSADGAYAFSAMFMGKDGENTSSFQETYASMRRPDRSFIDLAMTRTLLSDAVRQVRTRPIHGKFVGSLVFTPPCVEDFLASVQSNFLDDGALINGTSPYRNLLNCPVASTCVTVHCLPRDTRMIDGYDMTGDGYVAQDMPLIENGILRNFTLSRYGAAKTGLARSANEGGCYVMTPGETSLDDLIRGVERGILVGRISSGAPGSNGDITGVAKNSYLIENGKITDALSETMISGNLAEMLKNVVCVSRETVSNGGYVLPWVRTDGVTISGK